MKKLNLIKSFIHPEKMLRYRSMNVIISICIFVISSFLLGIPVGLNKIAVEKDLKDNYNFQVLSEIPNSNEINNVIFELVSKECHVIEGRELVCDSTNEELYLNMISFTTKEGITKRIYFVIDLFDIQTVYVGDVDINFEPKDVFTLEHYPHEENTEDYLVRFSSDSLYFQAHPYGTNSLNINHNGRLLRTDVLQIYYQNVLPEFEISLETTNNNGPKLGEYLLEQLSIGYQNTLRLKAYTLVFLVGVCFTLITIIILWFFFRKSGKLRYFTEFYNIAAVTSLPVSLLYFILLWFIPGLINSYIFVFSGFYLLVLYIINTKEELV